MSIISNTPAFATIRMIFWGVVAGVLLAGGIWCYFQYRDLQQLRVTNTDLVSKNKLLKSDQEMYLRNFTTCADANRENNQTIQHLLEERAKAQEAVDILANKQLATSDKLRALQSKLDTLDSNLSNGPIGEYLRETIRGIQQMDAQ